MALTRVAVYHRTVHASLARVRENVLDWEHLPFLHRTTFSRVRLLERGDHGFRAETALHGRRTAEPIVLDVRFDAEGLVYHTRTVQGPGTGSDIVTRLTVAAPHATAVEVSFLLPDVPPERAAALGDRLLRLYELLWDEDEAMMLRRQAYLDGTLPETFRDVLVDGIVYRHSTICPHLGGPLGTAPVEDGCIICPWHGHRFDVRTGRCLPVPAGVPSGPAA